MHFFFLYQFSLFTKLMQMRHDFGEASGESSVAKHTRTSPVGLIAVSLTCQPPPK